MPCAISFSWNGGEPKWAVISDFPDISACCASGCDIVTVNASSLFCWPGPNACSAAICSVTACTDTFTAGNATYTGRVNGTAMSGEVKGGSGSKWSATKK